MAAAEWAGRWGFAQFKAFVGALNLRGIGCLLFCFDYTASGQEASIRYQLCTAGGGVLRNGAARTCAIHVITGVHFAA